MLELATIAVTRPVRRPNMHDPRRHKSRMVPSEQRADGSRDAAAVTGRPVVGSLPNKYEDAATSQKGNGDLRKNGVSRNRGTSQSPERRISRAHWATIASWSPNAGPPKTPPKELSKANPMT